jgi:hypothetical protein
MPFSMNVIELSESGQISEACISQDSLTYFYNVLGILASHNKVPEQSKLQIVTWIVQRILSSLSQCTAPNSPQITRTLNIAKTVIKHFNREVTPALKQLFIQVVNHFLPFLEANLSNPRLSDQLIFFVHANIAVLGMEIVPLVEKVVVLCVERQSFEGLDSILGMMTDAY